VINRRIKPRPEQESGLSFIELIENKRMSIEGELTEANAPEFERRLQAFGAKAMRWGSTERILEISRLDIEGGVALVTALTAIRLLRARSSRLILTGAPQMLGHNLYRTGMLDGSAAIELVDMRLDEANGA
jgi:anti-anti-sigma regulatory factor